MWRVTRFVKRRLNLATFAEAASILTSSRRHISAYALNIAT
jgi:hypothetical protein